MLGCVRASIRTRFIARYYPFAGCVQTRHSIFFVKSALLVICGRGIAVAYGPCHFCSDLRRNLGDQALRRLLILLPLRVVDQDVIATDGDPMVARSVVIGGARRKFSWGPL